jgi:hypothetical protein
VVQTQRTVVLEVDGGPCRKPFGTDLACGRVLPPEQQCRACKTHVIIRNTTTIDLGYQGPAPQGAALDAAACAQNGVRDGLGVGR